VIPPEVPGFFSSTANPLAKLVAFISGLAGPGLKKFYGSGAGVSVGMEPILEVPGGLLLSMLCWLVLIELID
jgi:hypothetical protein